MAWLYVALIAVTIAGIALLIGHGRHERPVPSIAGGYYQPQGNPCLGDGAFDIVQSGQFVSLSNVAGSLSGQLRLQFRHGGHGDSLSLTGPVNCAIGGTQTLRGVAQPGVTSLVLGSLGGLPVDAVQFRNPPQPGAPLPYAPSSVAGTYDLAPRSNCFGGSFTLEGSGRRYAMVVGGQRLGTLAYASQLGALTGRVSCIGRTRVFMTGAATGTSLDVAVETVSTPVRTLERFEAARVRGFGHVLASFLIAVAAVILLARLFGMTAMRLGQPRVMGEVVAGIVLGPSVLGAISRQAQAQLFPADIIPAFAIAANLGLVFYMFLVGLELNPRDLRTRIGHAVAISNTSVALPLLLGVAVSLPLYELLAPETKFAGFALFLGVAMSITAFPVLARILADRRMLQRPIGALVLTCGAVDDAAGWLLIGIAATIAVATTFGDVVRTVAETVVFVAVMVLGVRPLLGRVSAAFDQSGRVPPGWVALIFSGILISAFTTELIGIAAIVGGFASGLVMPRNAELTEDVTRRVEDFTVTLLLPLFFAYIGLQMNVGLIDRPELWLITAGLVMVAIVGKFVGAAIPARLGGIGWRSAALIGTLMNTRGLSELIVLGVALQERVISSALFTMMVLMALITTFMAGPLVRLLDPRNELGAPVEEELTESRERSLAAFPALQAPSRAIMVAAHTDAALPTLRELGEPLARSVPPRELILVRLVRPPRAAGVRAGLQSEKALVQHAREQVERAQRGVVRDGGTARAVAFSSGHPGEDLARLAASEEIDLLLVDGQRPLLGDPVPLAEIEPVLARAPCDVGVLVAREGDQIGLGPGAAVVVPFGGAEHDWSALELGAWLASSSGATLKLLGAVGPTDESDAVRRRLDDAGVLVRGFAGIEAQGVVVSGGREGIVAAARGAGLLVVGLSERWKGEGLGEARSQLARSSAAPVLFVRRGQRVGALAPREDFTRFSWSRAGLGPTV